MSSTEPLRPARTRYAPSPTGRTHLGNLRTALFSWLLARRTGGQFILRIEDTDRNRFVPEAQAELMDSLRWLGITWDEGPDVGGAFAPYVQSQNREAYAAVAEQLVKAGTAYYCDCTPERLEVVRKLQQSRGQPPRYDNHCRDRALEAGPDRVIRLKMPEDGVTAVPDLVRHEVRFENRLIGDPVLLKSDGYPTYHLAVVVDDHRMQISHVLRAEEWLPSTPIHIHLYEALGWTHPVWAHLPLVTDFERRKIKKRDSGQGDEEYAEYVEMARVSTLREKGFLPGAVMNFLAFLGWHPSTTQEIFDPEGLIEAFSLDRLSDSPGVFDVDRLMWFNQQHLKRLSASQLATLALPSLSAAYPDSARLDDKAWLEKLIASVRDELITVTDVSERTRFAFHDPVEMSPEALEHLGTPKAHLALKELRESLPEEDTISPEAAEALFKGLRERLKSNQGLNGKQIMQPIRAALTGVTGGAHLTDIVVLIGADACRRRIDQALHRNI